MTIKQMAEAAGVSVDTVQRKVKDLFPELVQERRATNLPQNAAVAVMAEIRKLNFVTPTENLEVVTRSDLAEFGRALVGEMMKQFLPLIHSQPKQLEFTQDYFTIKGYASKLGITITYSEAISIGRAAAHLSREMGMEIKKADDERYGYVGSYHVTVPEKAFRP